MNFTYGYLWSFLSFVQFLLLLSASVYPVESCRHKTNGDQVKSSHVAVTTHRRRNTTLGSYIFQVLDKPIQNRHLMEGRHHQPHKGAARATKRGYLHITKKDRLHEHKKQAIVNERGTKHFTVRIFPKSKDGKTQTKDDFVMYELPDAYGKDKSPKIKFVSSDSGTSMQYGDERQLDITQANSYGNGQGSSYGNQPSPSGSGQHVSNGYNGFSQNNANQSTSTQTQGHSTGGYGSEAVNNSSASYGGANNASINGGEDDAKSQQAYLIMANESQKIQSGKPEGGCCDEKTKLSKTEQMEETMIQFIKKVSAKLELNLVKIATKIIEREKCHKNSKECWCSMGNSSYNQS